MPDAKQRAAFLDRVTRDWKQHAKDQTIEVERAGGAYIATGSELAMLRLLKAYRNTDKATQGFSANLGKHYFSLETPW